MKFKKTIATIGTVATLAIGGSQVPVAPKPLTLQEWQALSQTYNYEIKKQGSITIQNYTGDLKQINNAIRQRVPVETVTISGKKLTAAQYKTYRDTLLKKVESKKLIDVIFIK
jgi:hypothetical protein